MLDLDAITQSLVRVTLGLALSVAAAVASYVLGVGALRLIVGAALAVG